MVYFLCKAYDSDRQNCYFALSLPVRGAWIEIPAPEHQGDQRQRRSPCGERGLKCEGRAPLRNAGRRSPCGERGLKSSTARKSRTRLSSLPVRGAWIEIPGERDSGKVRCGRSPCGERGLKYSLKENYAQCFMSLPVRGAWIEITMWSSRWKSAQVAPRAGSVD